MSILRWFWDGDEDEQPEGLSRRRFLFLGLGAAAAVATAPLYARLAENWLAWDENAGLYVPTYADVIATQIEAIRPHIRALFENEATIYRLIGNDYPHLVSGRVFALRPKQLR